MGLAVIPVVGLLDYMTGPELSFSLFYLFPICLVAWFGGRSVALAASVSSAMIGIAGEFASGRSYSNPAVGYWNLAIRFAIFAILALLVNQLRQLLERERQFARQDHLTGAASARFFSELAEIEIDRCRRYKHPFTVAYLDLDNFKAVNDRLGHSAGDDLLRTVVGEIKTRLRKTDLVARLGGDEFALLLPETDSAAARVVMAGIRQCLLDRMIEKRWPVTFSVGVLTCVIPPDTVDDMIKLTDDLMYSIKNNGKNGVVYGTN